MGGKSKNESRQTTKTTSQNIVNDGDYAGVGGNVTHDESVTDIVSEVDNSINIDQEIDNSVEYDGEFAGSSGDINILDGGSIALAGEVASLASENLSKSLDFADNTVDKAFSFGSDAIQELSNTASFAINSVSESQRNSLDFAEESIAHLSDSASDFADNLSEVSAASMANNQQTLTAYGEDQTEQLETIANLAKSTSLQGQDIVAEQAGKMVLYIVVGVVVFGLAAVFLGRGK